MISRRRFMTGCAALPVLAGAFDARRRARAAGTPAAPPLRLLIVGQLEGNLPDVWASSGSDTSFVLSDVLSPLEPWRSRLLVLQGFANQTAIKNLAGDTHGAALTGILTGNASKLRQENDPTHAAPSESLDQFLRDKINGPTRVPSLELTVGAACVSTSTDFSYPRGGGGSIIPIGKPSQVFDTLFAGVVSGGAPDDPAARRLRALRASVLDHVGQELGTVMGRVGKSDAAKIQAHLQAVRDLEKQVAATTPLSCTAPARPVDLSATDKSTIPASSKLMMDMIVQAFACDVTRMVTFSISNSGFPAGAPWLNEPRDIHLISHNKFADVAWTDVAPKIMKWSYQQLAYLVGALAKVPEGDGTLLDHTLILSIGEFGDSGGHGYTNLPILMVGDAGGYLRTGRLVNGAGKPHNDILVTVANAVGVEVATFGDPTLCMGGPLAALRA